MADQFIQVGRYSEGVRFYPYFYERYLALKIKTECYGHHGTDLEVAFDNPDTMESLGLALIEKAKEAKRFFKENP